MLRKSAFLFVAKMAGYTLRLALPIALVRILSVPDFGAYRQFFLVEILVLSVFQLGVSQALFYFVPRDKDNSVSYLVNSLFLNLCLFGVSIAVLRVAVEPISSLLKMPILMQQFWLIAADILALMLQLSLDCYLLARERIKASAVFEIGGLIVSTIVALITALLTRDLGIVLTAVVASRIAQLIAMLLFVFWRCARNQVRLAFRDMGHQVRYGVVLGTGGAIGAFFQRVHSMIVSGNYGAEGFAYYSAGCTEIPLVQYFTQGVATVTLPQFASLVMEKQWDSVRKLWREVLVSSYAVAIPVCVVFILIAKPLIVIMFTAQYASAAAIFMINTATRLGFIWNATLVLRAMGRNDITFYVNGACLLIGPPLMILAAKLGGMEWVLVVNGVIFITSRLIMVMLLNRVSGLHLAYCVPRKSLLEFYVKTYREVLGMRVVRTLLGR